MKRMRDTDEDHDEEDDELSLEDDSNGDNDDDDEESLDESDDDARSSNNSFYSDDGYDSDLFLSDDYYPVQGPDGEFDYYPRDGGGNLYVLGELLGQALRDGNYSYLQELLANGAHVDFRRYGKTLLYMACVHDRWKMAKLLMENGANVNADKPHYNDYTPVFMACQAGQLDILKLMIENGGDVNVEIHADFDDGYPLHVTCEKGHLEMTKLLVENGAKVNVKNGGHLTPLHMAAMKGNAEIVNLLLKNGADLKAKSENGKTALDLACENHRKDVVWVLVRQFPSLVLEWQQDRTFVERATRSTHKLADTTRKSFLPKEGTLRTAGSTLAKALVKGISFAMFTTGLLMLLESAVLFALCRKTELSSLD